MTGLWRRGARASAARANTPVLGEPVNDGNDGLSLVRCEVALLPGKTKSAQFGEEDSAELRAFRVLRFDRPAEGAGGERYLRGNFDRGFAPRRDLLALHGGG